MVVASLAVTRRALPAEAVEAAVDAAVIAAVCAYNAVAVAAVAVL